MYRSSRASACDEMYNQADHRHYQQKVNQPACHVEGSPGNQPHYQQNEEKDQKQESHQSTPGGWLAFLWPTSEINLPLESIDGATHGTLERGTVPVGAFVRLEVWPGSA